MSPQGDHELAALRRELQETRGLLEAEREHAAQCQTLLDQERTARASADNVNALKDEFLAIVSHELRSPLTSIAGWAHILRRGASAEDLDKGLEVIDQSVRLQAKLIEDLLDISRITSGRLSIDLQPVEPRGFIDAAVEAVRPAAEAKDIHIRKVLDLSAGPVSGDAGRLQQVMVNLLSNAVKFTPEGGRVEVRVQRCEEHAQISVSDDGMGIPAAFLPHVFDRFRQADTSIHQRHGGLGLGLAIVKHLVELHGGSVTAASPGEGQGATFILRLPLRARRAAPAPARAAKSPDAALAARDANGVPVETAAQPGG
jgi:signal transduction histidine kinase